MAANQKYLFMRVIRHIQKALLALGVLLMTSTLLGLSITHQPVRVSALGTQLPIVISSSDLNGFSRATLRARIKGSTNYHTIPMIGSGRRFSAKIPAYLVKPSGVEYYIEAVDDRGQKFSYPSSNAPGNPVVVKVSSQTKALAFRLLSPKRNAVTEQWRPVISMTIANSKSLLDLRRVRIFLDDANITQSVKFRGNFMQYRPPLRLRMGQHQIRAEGYTLSGERINSTTFSFYVKVRDLDETYKKKQLSGKPRVA